MPQVHAGVSSLAVGGGRRDKLNAEEQNHSHKQISE